MNLVRISKFLSLILRHQPEKIGLSLDANGWAAVDDLIRRANENGVPLTVDLLEKVVAENDKKRFAFSDDCRRIRASQGHSVEVDLALAPSQPPTRLFHGTAERFLPSIRQKGLLPGSRQHVHLSSDAETAVRVGQRHGKPVVLTILAQEMAAAGQVFYLSANGVWLTDHVPVVFIQFALGTE